MNHGLAESIEQLDREPPAFRDKAADFIDGLVSHYVFGDGNLVVAHAGMKDSMQGWAAEYRGKALVVYGYTPIPDSKQLSQLEFILRTALQ